MEIGDKIKALRKEKGMTQDAIAEALDISRQAVAKWESNQSAPTTANIMKLADLFQVPYEELLSQEETPNTEIWRHIVKTAEDNRKIKRRISRAVMISGLKIIACYLVLMLLCCFAFDLFSAPDYVWSWSLSHYVIPAVMCFSLAGCLLYLEKLGYYTLAGTALGIILGNIVGSITTKGSILHFNNGWIALLGSIGAFSLLGLIITILKTGQESEIDPIPRLEKIRRIVFCVLSVCLVLFIILWIGASVRQLTFQAGASAGYKAGYEQGLSDRKNSLPADISLDSTTIPGKYRLGSAYNGYMIYWQSGYKDGYEGR
ncbi:MAG: helix-turn-helix domain-containing protein [Eubacteriales bacterium]|nr:helix-turn-helix domain-containing protein [Eubacteriales bacterium]